MKASSKILYAPFLQYGIFYASWVGLLENVVGSWMLYAIRHGGMEKYTRIWIIMHIRITLRANGGDGGACFGSTTATPHKNWKGSEGGNSPPTFSGESHKFPVTVLVCPSFLGSASRWLDTFTAYLFHIVPETRRKLLDLYIKTVNQSQVPLLWTQVGFAQRLCSTRHKLPQKENFATLKHSTRSIDQGVWRFISENNSSDIFCIKLFKLSLWQEHMPKLSKN